MKKLLLGIWLLTGLATQAQNVGGGASAGLVLSQVNGDFYGGYNKVGWQAGGYAWYDLNERLLLQPEILVTNRGSRENMANYRLSMTYIDVPVLLGVKLAPAKNVHLIVHAGPSIGYLIDAQHGWNIYRNEVTDRFTKVDVGGQAGVTCKVTSNVSIFGRIGLSFNDNRNRSNPLTPAYTTHNYLVFGVRVHAK